ncbi:pyridoxal phosphate-dependent aminotransferase (plasmid) [Entomospira entomophila]|uniref:cysteine-S-conjugate beta-lyase n=1 Tax=Entomospira entomophila TaxID=2719988 RepID=A0A968KS54_9SPIO|nr:MalY/PatB family protein [Entomospira entomophilus]NIZ41458.1 pyridoxal phosphate-dependent aminotransferase [Entomospira entomophilus]WDI36292.1 pyridoxal phosphate-dependent aminotransferase [Entomospira entomophilus]
MSHFDDITQRKETNSVKYDCIHLSPSLQEDPTLLPMWVADMDFPTAPAIIEAIHKVVNSGIFGYSNRPDSYNQAIIDWYQQKYHYTMHADRLAFSPCVMTSIAYLLETLVTTGNQVLIQTPVYPEFAHAIQERGAIVVENPLLCDEYHQYHLDKDDFQTKIAQCQLFILCSPHNPVGKVWSKDDLEWMLQMAEDHQVPIISDEIHCDLVFAPHHHYMLGSLRPTSKFIYTLFSASKTFNLASLHASSLYFPTQKEYDQFQNWLKKWHINRNNILSLPAVESAYRYGDAWLTDLKSYLQENITYITQYFQEHMPKLAITPMEASYLMWIDCRAFNKDDEALKVMFYEEAKVILNMGVSFGTGGSGFVRMNIATQKSRIKDALQRWHLLYQTYIGF